MPLCMGCGASYESIFKFCPFCGRVKPESQVLKVEVSVSSADKWETCHIETRSESDSEGRPDESIGGYWAKAIGPNGMYLAGESPMFRTRNGGYSGERVAHTFLVNQLAKAGWEALPSAGDWWATQFRRQVKDGNPEPWQVWVTIIDKFDGHFLLRRFPEIPRGKQNVLSGYLSQYELIGKSEHIKKGFFEVYAALDENSDRRRILDEFVARLVNEKGFEQVENAVNEELKRCLAQDIKNIRYHRILLRRKK